MVVKKYKNERYVYYYILFIIISKFYLGFTLMQIFLTNILLILLSISNKYMTKDNLKLEVDLISF